MTERTTRNRVLPVIVLSGGTGHTGEELVRAALDQFEKPNVEIILQANVRSVRAAVEAVRQAEESGAVICHTLVVPGIREAVVEEAKRRSVPLVDILGPVLTVLGDHLESHPRYQPGLSYARQKEHLERFGAVDFALAHDDGARLRDIDRADVVLVGVSRCCKSVTCFYLAFRGIRAGSHRTPQSPL